MPSPPDSRRQPRRTVRRPGAACARCRGDRAERAPQLDDNRVAEQQEASTLGRGYGGRVVTGEARPGVPTPACGAASCSKQTSTTSSPATRGEQRFEGAARCARQRQQRCIKGQAARRRHACARAQLPQHSAEDGQRIRAAGWRITESRRWSGATSFAGAKAAGAGGPNLGDLPPAEYAASNERTALLSRRRRGRGSARRHCGAGQPRREAKVRQAPLDDVARVTSSAAEPVDRREQRGMGRTGAQRWLQGGTALNPQTLHRAPEREPPAVRI